MVKKTKPSRVWERKQNFIDLKNDKAQQKISAKESWQNMIDSFIVENSNNQDPQLSSQSIKNHQSLSSQKQQHFLQDLSQNNNMDQVISQQKYLQKVQQLDRNNREGFLITIELIKILKEKVYKEIVLNEFIQTNDSFNYIQESRQTSVGQNCRPKEKVKNQERLKIQQFIFQESLEIPKYYKQFQNQQQNYQKEKRSYHHAQIKIKQSKKMSKRDFLAYSNSVLLDFTNIKFLNIYGPTGSGKTFMLKSIFNDVQVQNKLIWVNGMSIIKGKTKRFLTDLKHKFDSLLWQAYCNSFQNETNSQQDLFKAILSKQNQKILVIDEYDQAAHFNMTDLLRYSYLKDLNINPKQKNSKIFFISKIILVSNIFNTEINQCFGMQNDFGLISKKTLYIQNLVFKPFSDKQAVQILKTKINNVNEKFKIFFVTQQYFPKQIFQQNPYGIFTNQKLFHLTKKISYGDEVDIRKILFFYSDSIKKFIQLLQQIIEKNPQKLVKKFQQYLIDEKFLFDFFSNNKVEIATIGKDQSRNKKYDWTIDEYSDPIIFYIFNLENEGKSILLAIYKQSVSKNKRKIQTHQANENNQLSKLNHTASNQKTSLQKRKQSIVSVKDFYMKIRPRLQFTKIFHWIFQFQQVGLLKIRKDLSLFSGFESASSKKSLPSSYPIKVMDDFEVEIRNKEAIQRGLSIY